MAFQYSVTVILMCITWSRLANIHTHPWEPSKVLHALGRGDDQKVAMVKALQDYANMIKVGVLLAHE